MPDNAEELDALNAEVAHLQAEIHAIQDAESTIAPEPPPSAESAPETVATAPEQSAVAEPAPVAETPAPVEEPMPAKDNAADPGTVMPGQGAPSPTKDPVEVAKTMTVYGGTSLTEEKINAYYLWQTEDPDLVALGHAMLARLKAEQDAPVELTPWQQRLKAMGRYNPQPESAS